MPSRPIEPAGGAPVREYSARLPIGADGLQELHGLLDRLRDENPQLVPADRLSFRTAIAELVANVIDHGRASASDAVAVTAAVTAHRLVGSVVARGEDLGRLAPPDPVPEDAERGRGLLMAHALCDVDYAHDDGVNTWSVQRRRSDADGQLG